MKKDERKILKVEAFDFVMDSLRRYHNHQLHACLYMNGHIEEETLRQAVIKSFCDLPQLNATYVKGCWRENAQPEAFQIEVREGEYAKSQIEMFFGATKLQGEMFQIKISIFRTEEKDTVCIVVNHMLMDATGFKKYLYLLCELYNEAFTENPQSIQYAGESRNLSWVRKRKVAHRPRGRKPIRERIPIQRGDIPCYMTEKIPKDRMDRIKQYAKEHGVTLNDYIMTGYYIAIQKVFGCTVRSICCAVDLRRYQKESTGLCNQVGNAFCTIKDGKDMEFSKLLKHVHRQMKDEKEKGYCLKQIKSLNSGFTRLPLGVSRRLIDEVISNPKVAITNLGIIEEEKLFFAGVETEDCFITGSLKNAPNLQLAISTYKGEGTLGINMLLTKSERVRLTYFLQVLYVTLMNPIVDG